jgi:hypothetical protein
MFTDVSEEYFSLECQRNYKKAATKKEAKSSTGIHYATSQNVAFFNIVFHKSFVMQFLRIYQLTVF